MQTLDPYKIPLESINLIEASAGTGKSWTVTLLFLRLILEKNLTVDQILVVTFTEAATKELRDDVRQRLVSALEAFRAVDQHGLTEDLRSQRAIGAHALQRRTATGRSPIRQLERARSSRKAGWSWCVFLSFGNNGLRGNQTDDPLKVRSVGLFLTRHTP